MAEGVEGLTRDKTRMPGKEPLSTDTVQRVVDLALGPPPGEETHWTGRMLAKAAGVSLRSVQRIRAASHPHVQAVDGPEVRREAQRRPSASTSILPPIRLFSRSTRRDPMGSGWRPTLQQGEVSHKFHFGGDPCKLSPIDPKRRPLSALTLARFSSRWNSVDRPGWLHRCHRAAEKRCRSIQFAAAMSLACGRGSLSSRTKFNNAVEGFFAKLTRQRLKRGVFRSVIDLQVAINRFVAETNLNPKPFVWTADPKRVLAAVKRGKQTFKSVH